MPLRAERASRARACAVGEASSCSGVASRTNNDSRNDSSAVHEELVQGASIDATTLKQGGAGAERYLRLARLDKASSQESQMKLCTKTFDLKTTNM